MAITQAQLADQMIRQLRILDPSVSAAVGTPERKIIDTVAQALADAQIDLTALSSALDLDSKFGANLDRFLALFGFARKAAVAASGFVEFSRTTASNIDIRIPTGTQVANNVEASATTQASRVTFVTTADVILASGVTRVVAPVQAVIPGATGNVAADKIKAFVGFPTLGVTGITNPAPTTGGVDSEGDDALKVRFKNTIFRNLSGTEDQYLALAVSTPFTTKANVVGPISRYREYIQVPNVDDSQPDTVEDLNGNPLIVSGNRASATDWTTALSTIPYSKYIYDTVPAFTSNGEVGALTAFYQQDVEFRVNIDAAAKYAGDTYRLAQVGVGLNPLTAIAARYQPNVSFLNVYNGTDATVKAIRPGAIVLFEHSYLSGESRNDLTRNVTNCVDVFINGSNLTLGTTVVPKPDGTKNLFVNNAAAKLHYDNYRRVDQTKTRPLLGNLYIPLPMQPVIDLPDSITVNGETYYKGTHYWPIEDVTELRGTLRCRNGIEWSAKVKGQLGSGADPMAGPYTGTTIIANAGTAITVANYSFDKNIIDLQSAYEGAKQVTTDVLAHKARIRYFKLDVSVMYAPGASPSQVNLAVRNVLTTFLEGQYFGTTIQLSDLLQIIHNVPGIDNVRWTRDVDNTKTRVIETNRNGEPITTLVVDRTTPGTPSAAEVQSLYFVGVPTGGTFTLTHSAKTTTAIAWNATAATINAALTAAGIAASITAGTGTLADPFLATFTANGWKTEVISVGSSLTGEATLNTDFFLKDNELPALAAKAAGKDTVAGLLIRPRAQNTWGK